MTEQDKQALIKHFCERDCGEEFAKECAIMPCHEIELIQEFPTTEPDADTISRAKAIAEVEKARAYVGHRYNIESMVGRDIFEMLDNVGLGISKLPPAQPEQPEPKRGEWLERDVIDEPKGKHITQWQSARCSVCGRYHTTPYLYSFTHYNFCPNCGADMREVTT